MDAYDLQNLQRAADAQADMLELPADLLELLVDQFVATDEGRRIAADPALRAALVAFLDSGRAFLLANRVVGHGMLEGGYTLVFGDGTAVPLAAGPQAAAARPQPVYPVTTPRETRMHGMRGGEDPGAVAVTGRR
jgi:hypothetical protein